MATNIISLNQIIDLFKDFSNRHYQINDFGYGPTSDIGTSVQMKFPYMWVTTQQDSIISVENRTAIPSLKFACLFMDKTNIQPNVENINGVDSNNIQEILSDQLQILQDFITEIQVNFSNFGMIIDGDVTCYPAVDETQDSVNGWVGEFSLKLRHSNCITPTGDIVVDTNLTPINPVSRYLTCDTVTACTSLQEYVATHAGGNTSITSADGSVTIGQTGQTFDLSVAVASSTLTLLIPIRNETGTPLLKGEVVYINGAAGNKCTVDRAIASNEDTSAKVIALVQNDIPNNQNGYGVQAGQLTNANTLAYSAGTRIWLSPTIAGGYTTVQPYAPNHAVHLGVISRSHQNQGTIDIAIVNTQELNESSDVSVSGRTSGDVLTYNGSLWVNQKPKYTTGFTFNTSNYVLTLNQQDNTSLTANLSILASDMNVTGGTYNPNTGVATFTNNSGGTFTVSGFLTGLTDTYVTGLTFSNNILSVKQTNGQADKTVTINNFGSITATTISATTYSNLPRDVFVTGGTYSNGTATLRNNTGGTFNITGFYTGYTAPTDIRVTGGTYSNGTATFRNNTGGTFTVTGFYTNANDIFVTGGTYNSGTGTITFRNNTGGTFTVTGITAGGGGGTTISGTPNYIPKFNSTGNNIDNSVIYQNPSGYIGIGLTGATNLLHVGGSGYFQSDNDIFVGTSGPYWFNKVKVGNVGQTYTVAVGQNVLSNISSADFNTAIGSNSQTLNENGAGNTSVGTSTLYNNFDGRFNVAVGLNSMAGITGDSGGGTYYEYNGTGSDNVGVGNYQLNSDVNAEDNALVGNNILGDATVARRNAIVGKDALKNVITQATNNSIFGFKAGFNADNANENSLFGYNSLYNGYNIWANTAMGIYSLYDLVNGEFNNWFGSYLKYKPDNTPFTGGNYTLAVGKADYFTGVDQAAVVPHIWSPDAYELTKYTDGVIEEFDAYIYSSAHIEYTLESENGDLLTGTIRAVWNQAGSLVNYKVENVDVMGSFQDFYILMSAPNTGKILLGYDSLTYPYDVFLTYTSRLILRKYRV